MLFQDSHQYHDYLDDYEVVLESEAIRSERIIRKKTSNNKDMEQFSSKLSQLPEIKPSHLDYSLSKVTIGKESDITLEEKERLKKLLMDLHPWKKGPWSIFGIEIDAEWRSDLKWERILEQGLNLQGKRVADIGCNNGYFMFRMLNEEPELVIGFEPYIKNYYAFNMFQHYVKSSKLHFELLGVENIDLYPKFFDTIFCMGILYHHTDPIGILRKLYGSLAKGGEIIIDCQGIPGEEATALMPAGKYAGAKGFWWLPTLNCLEVWLKRTQFRDVQVFFKEPLSVDEQRSSSWADIKSLRSFLDPGDITKTVEGYPAPWRFYVKARK